MSKKDEALKLALEAFEYVLKPTKEFDEDVCQQLHDNAITVIREALAERCVCGEPDTPGTHRTDGPCLAEQPAQQEPVAWVCEASSSDEKHAIDYWPGDVDGLPIGTKLYTSPQSKPWVGLTDEEIDTWNIVGHESLHEFVRAIEAKLKEKNT